MENQHCVPKLPRLAATARYPPNTAPEGRNPHRFPQKNIPANKRPGIRCSPEDALLGCQGNSLFASPRRPAGRSLVTNSPEEEVIKEKHLTTMLNSHPVCGNTHTEHTQLLRGNSHAHGHISSLPFTPLTPTGKTNGKLCPQQLSLVETHSSALHCT